MAAIIMPKETYSGRKAVLDTNFFSVSVSSREAVMMDLVLAEDGSSAGILW